MSKLVRKVLLLLACTAAACAGTDSGPSDDDGGDFTNPTDDGSDDSGDTGDDGGDTGDDTGDDGSGACESEVVEAPAGGACAAATQTCAAACEDDACWEACVAADPNADGCGTCLEDGFLACANARGCQEAWDAMTCCYEQCADPDSAECETSCTAESDSYGACTEPHEEACTEEVDTLCFGA